MPRVCIRTFLTMTFLDWGIENETDVDEGGGVCFRRLATDVTATSSLEQSTPSLFDL